jgi:endogenous inhibitor of DNA gyrase (YacG/DUF329 family)
MVCSICGSPFLISESNAPPFCSERCKLIDLGRWLDEEITMPHEGGGHDSQEHDSQKYNDEEP